MHASRTVPSRSRHESGLNEQPLENVDERSVGGMRLRGRDAQWGVRGQVDQSSGRRSMRTRGYFRAK